MKPSFFSCILMTCAAAAFADQTSSSSERPTPTPTTTVTKLTLSGCVTPGATGSDPFTFTMLPSDTTATPARYRLSGTDVKPYAGKRVQIVGGLIPSANAAGSAGASPSSGGAVATTGVSGTIAGATARAGAVVLPEFRIVTVKPLNIPCAPR